MLTQQILVGIAGNVTGIGRRFNTVSPRMICCASYSTVSKVYWVQRFRYVGILYLELEFPASLETVGPDLSRSS